MQTVYTNTFPGMVADPRDTRGCQLCKHFDNFTKKSSLVPYRGSEDAFVSQTTIQLQNFLMYGGNMYALGRQVATAKAIIYINTNIAATSWAGTSGQDNTYNITDFTLFVEYKGILWGANSKPGLWSYNIGSTTFTEAAQDLTYTSITQGLIHSKDDVLYFGYTNATATYIASKNGAGGWNITALTLPTNLKVVSLCEYGNYLAIGCAPIQIGGKSKVFLWDRDSSVLTLAESIDVGNKILTTLENIDGYLIAISLSGSTNAVISPRMVFSKYLGGGFKAFDEILLATGTVPVITGKQKSNNRLYFGLSASSFGYSTQYDYVGIWSVGKNSESEDFSINMVQLADNDTLPQAIKNFIIVEDYFYISYLDAGTGDYGLSKTNDQVVYGVTCAYKFPINPGNMPEGDRFKKKTVKAVAVAYEPLPGTSSAYQVALKYKVDGSAFVTVFTKTDDAVVGTKVITEAGKDTDGNSLEKGKDLEFQVESKGVVVTGLIYIYETDISLINPKT